MEKDVPMSRTGMAALGAVALVAACAGPGSGNINGNGGLRDRRIQLDQLHQHDELHERVQLHVGELQRHQRVEHDVGELEQQQQRVREHPEVTRRTAARAGIAVWRAPAREGSASR